MTSFTDTFDLAKLPEVRHTPSSNSKEKLFHHYPNLENKPKSQREDIALLTIDIFHLIISFNHCLICREKVQPDCNNFCLKSVFITPIYCTFHRIIVFVLCKNRHFIIYAYILHQDRMKYSHNNHLLFQLH